MPEDPHPMRRRPHPPLPGERPSLWGGRPLRRPFEFRPAAERVRATWEDTWVEYPALSRLREDLFAFLGFPVASPGTARVAHSNPLLHVQGALLVGPAAHGTTGFLKTLVADAERLFRRRILLVDMPVDCRPISLWEAILGQIAPRALADPSFRTIPYLILSRELGRAGVAAIAIDGVGHLLSLDARRRTKVLARLRAFSDDEGVRLVMAVPDRLATEVLGGYDPDRFRFTQPFLQPLYDEKQPYLPYYLPRFRVDPAFLDLLDLWERTLPLCRPSNLAGRDMALRLFELTDGNHGVLATVLRRAAVAAIGDGSERVTIELLDRLDLRNGARFSGFRF